MFMRSRSNQNHSPAQVAEGISNTLAHGAEEAANRVSDAVGSAGARVTREAGQVSGIVAREAGHVSSRVARRRGQAGEALLKAQLAKTSRELAHESSELGDAVQALNKVIKANRKAAARGRTRLIGGLVIGAALMYHLDPDRGRQRRIETARRVRGITGGGQDMTGSAQPTA
jgi:hypothetical protein